MGTICFHLRRIRTRPVGNAVPGVPRSSTEPKQPVRRIRRHPVGRIHPRCRARRVGATYNELTRIRPNAFMWEDPAAECRGRRSLQFSAADSPDVAAHLRCCCGTGHGLDAVPYKALLSCFDGDGKRNNKCPQIMDTPPALRAIRARLCGMGVLFNTLLPPQAPPKKIPGSWDFLHSAHEIPPCAAEKPCKSSPLAVR